MFLCVSLFVSVVCIASPATLASLQRSLFREGYWSRDGVCVNILQRRVDRELKRCITGGIDVALLDCFLAFPMVWWGRIAMGTRLGALVHSLTIVLGWVSRLGSGSVLCLHLCELCSARDMGGECELASVAGNA